MRVRVGVGQWFRPKIVVTTTMTRRSIAPSNSAVNQQPLRIDIEIQHRAQIRGELSVAGVAEVRRFTGWLGLLGALQDAVDDERSEPRPVSTSGETS
jgi:hypothetical protein